MVRLAKHAGGYNVILLPQFIRDMGGRVSDMSPEQLDALDPLLVALDAELEDSVSERTTAFTVDGRQYFRTLLSTGQCVVHRPATEAEASQHKDVSLPAYIMYSIDSEEAAIDEEKVKEAEPLHS
jgi:hypothetical protein